MKKIYLYKGYHSPETFELFQKSWQEEDCIIFCPPQLKDFSFVEKLPKAHVELVGDLWPPSISIPEPQQSSYPEKPCAGVFTSGTTQSPKLVLYSKTNLVSSVENIFELFKGLPIDNIFCYPQPFHTFGLTLGFAAATIMKWKLHIPQGKYSREHHKIWLESVNSSSITLGTPTHFHDLIHDLKENNRQAPQTCSSIIGGARVPRQLWLDSKDHLNIEAPSIGYGATEASPGVTHLPPGVEPTEDGEIGAPLKHLRVSLQPDGLLFSGPSLCLATIQEGQLLFLKDFVLPDVIHVREENRWVYQTRSKWFINRGGEKFSLERIEQDIFNAIQIGVLGFPLADARLGEELGLLIQCEEEKFLEIKALIYSLLEKVFGRSFNKDNCMRISKLPKNENLKKDRKAAQEIFAKHSHQAQPPATP